MRRGFTLIEVIVALGIVGVLIAATSALIGGIPLSGYVNEGNVALSAASDEIEALRANGYNALPASGAFSSSLVSSLPSGAGVVTVSNYDDKTKEIVVTVSWIGKDGGGRSASLTTLITKIGGLP